MGSSAALVPMDDSEHATDAAATPISTALARLSCTSCRDRKQKCDKSLPVCRRCTSLRHDCAYPSSRKSSQGKRKQVRDLEAKLLQLEDQLKIIRGSTDTDNYRPPQMVRTAAASPNVTCSSPVGSSAGESWLSEATIPQRGDVEEPHNRQRQQLVDWLADRELESTELDDVPVSPGLIKKLTTLYFNNGYHCSPMIHPSRYLESLHSDPPDRQPPLFLQFVIMATGASTDPLHAPLAVSLYRRARKFAEEDEAKGYQEPNAFTLAHAQFWMLMANFEAQNTLFSRASLSLGKSIRIAQILNLHQLNRGPQPPSLFQSHLGRQSSRALDWIEMEEHRRTWWVIYSSDRLVFATSALPSIIDDRLVHTLLPMPEEAFTRGANEMPEEHTTTLRQALRERSSPASRLGARALAAHLFYRAVDLEAIESQSNAQGDNNQVSYWAQQQEVGNDLLALLVSLPGGLRLPANIGCQDAIFVNILIHTALMCLHKTAIRKAAEDGGRGAEAGFIKAQGRSKLLAAAAQVIAIIRSIKEEDLTEALKNPIQSYAAYIASLVFLEDFAVTNFDGSSSNVVFLLDILQRFSHTHPVARMLAGQLGQELGRLGLVDAGMAQGV
ncbi:putative binuclear zinc transcription factor [Triangularia setosa]|uniref:Binuclear zinc transcription factor n=1 Tax=Triangularia setosa TaxID=2587417 RepID=A0AAN6W2P9_9PEZI|nr:putative binuclear zinc transcription factor [Podospora setosa]